MIIITPNPAIDRTMIVPALKVGEVNRSTQTIIAAGGKGMNAARAVKVLGGSALCMGFIGGRSGATFAKLAEAEGFRTSWTRMNGETRTCLIVVDESGEPTVINEPGPEISEVSWETLHTDVLATYKMHAGRKVSHLVALCGSLPPGSSTQVFAQLIHDLRKVGAHVWVDTSGAALKAALTVAPAGIKVNVAEASAAVGRSLPGVREVVEAAREIHQRGIEFVVITLGKSGAVLVNGDGAWHAHAILPSIKVVSNVGSGDSFFGALLLALEKHMPAPEVLRYGVAAGAANTLSAGGGMFSWGDFESMLEATRVEVLLPT